VNEVKKWKCPVAPVRSLAPLNTVNEEGRSRLLEKQRAMRRFNTFPWGRYLQIEEGKGWGDGAQA
jgi:hypothetical protein